MYVSVETIKEATVKKCLCRFVPKQQLVKEKKNVFAGKKILWGKKKGHLLFFFCYSVILRVPAPRNYMNL